MSAAAAPTPEQIAQIIKNASYWVRGTQMSFVAWYAITLWDWVTSLQREYRLIHKSPWSPIKVSYLLCRYWVIITGPLILWTFVGDHDQETCNKIFRIPELIAMWNQIWAEIVLVIRTYAFYGNNVPLLIGLLSCMVGMVVFQIYSLVAGMMPLPFLNPPTGPCFPAVRHVGSPLVMLFFIVPLVFDSMVTILTVVRAFKLRSRMAGAGGSPLMKMFVREGLFYFILIAAANLVNGIFYWQPNAAMAALNVPLTIMLTDILACRLILDLRERGQGGRGNTTANNSYPLSQQRKQVSSNSGVRVVTSSKTAVETAPGKGGVVSQMDFNHEMTTFSTVSKADRRVDVVPVQGGTVRVDIEEAYHYDDDRGDSDTEKGRSFMP